MVGHKPLNIDPYSQDRVKLLQAARQAALERATKIAKTRYELCLHLLYNLYTSYFVSGAYCQPSKWEPPVPTRVGKKKKRGPDASSRLPAVYPTTRCKLKMLKMERIKDYLLMEEEFVANQAAQSGEDRTAADRTKVDELRGSPMGVGSLEEIIDDDHAIVSLGSGSEYYVAIMSFVDKDLLEPGCSVLLHHKTHAVVGVLADDTDPMVSVMKLDKAPTESYADIGGLETQIQEIKESVELPLTHPELYEEMGIRPPKGVILYGVPGTGKTLLAKAVANQTSATFLRIVGSELIQKYLGDGPKLVRELFRVAEEHAPSIVFIDEIDAVGTKRYDSTSSGEREIQRTMLELLNQLDGFDTRGDVKVIMATNRVRALCVGFHSLTGRSSHWIRHSFVLDGSIERLVRTTRSFLHSAAADQQNSPCRTRKLRDTFSNCTLRGCLSPMMWISKNWS